MTDPIPVTVAFPAGQGATCNFTVPGSDGLEVLMIMLRGDIGWVPGVEMLMDLYDNFLDGRVLQVIETNLLNAQKCGAIIQGLM